MPIKYGLSIYNKTYKMYKTRAPLTGWERTDQRKKGMQGAAKEEKLYTATQARKDFAEIVDTAYFGERVIIQKRDRQVALVSMSFLERVDRLLEAEAELEAELAKKALQEFQSQGGRTMDELESDLEVD